MTTDTTATPLTPGNSRGAAATFAEGRDAALRRVVIGDNPYQPTDPRHWVWMSGWCNAHARKDRNA